MSDRPVAACGPRSGGVQLSSNSPSLLVGSGGWSQNAEDQRAAYDTGDHLQPNEAGLQAIANAANLTWFSTT